MNEYSLKEWFQVQGYDLDSLPSTITWYRPDFVDTNMFKPYRGSRVATRDGTPSAHRGRITSDYFIHNAKIYRSLGLVVNPRFLDREEYKTLQKREDVTIYDEGMRRPVVIEPKENSNPTPRLAQAIMTLMQKQNTWVGTPSALLSELGSKTGIPKSASALSSALVQDKILMPLTLAQIVVGRGRSSKERVIKLERQH